MSTKAPTPQEVADTERDDEVFQLTHSSQRMNMIRSLLNDPRKQLFGHTTVLWLFDQEYSARREVAEAKRRIRDLELQLATQREPMPKGKAITQQAKVIARMANAITDVMNLRENYSDGTATDDVAFGNLLRLLREWEDEHQRAIDEAAES